MSSFSTWTLNETFGYSNFGTAWKVAKSAYVVCWIAGSAFGTRVNRKFTYKGDVNLQAGTNKIALLSVAVGLPVSFFNPLDMNLIYSDQVHNYCSGT